jgi:SAM-dependent methyltransferase
MKVADLDRIARYEVRWRDLFDEHIAALLVEEISVLDVGSGRQPTLAPADRPRGCSYVGLDIARAELSAAGVGAYDDIVIADITLPQQQLRERFDLAVSWQVLEHVKPLDLTFENIRSYLRPGGSFVAQLSGSFSVFALVNRAMPRELGLSLLEKLTRRDRRTVYAAHYDRCYASALRRMLDPWSHVQIVPRFRGASYFSFSQAAQRAYLFYEDWVIQTGRENLATHYLVVAQK